MFQRDIDPMCEIHATRANLKEEERQDALKELRARKRQIERQIKALIFGAAGNGEAAGD
jgi:cell division protein FtsB